jgi:hypothetical protein
MKRKKINRRVRENLLKMHTPGDIPGIEFDAKAYATTAEACR